MTQPTLPAVDPTRCPLCNEQNACGAAKGAGACWCFAQEIPEGVVNRVPEEIRGMACVCERCASGRRSATEAQTIIERLGRDR